MRKFISAVTSAAMAATMVSSLAPAVVNAADATKGFSIQTYSASDSKYAKDGNNVSVSSADIAAGDVVIPCAVYLDEATPSTEAISLQLSVSGPDAKGIKFTMYNDGGEINTEDAYFSSEKEFSVGGSTVSSENPVTFAGTASYGSFVAAGMSVPACKQGLSAANIENYYIGLSWTSLGKEYKWTGSKSTDFPVFVFDVTIPKGTKAGDYTLDFLTYNTSKTGGNNPATMIEVTKTDSFDGRYTKEAGNLKLSGMNIKVGEGSSTVSTSTTTKEGPTQTTSTTTKVTPPVGDKDVDFDFGKWTAKPGDTVEVPVMIDSHGNVVISVDCELAVDSPLELVGISDVSPAFKNAAVTGDPATKCLNFASMTGQGKGRVPSTTAPAFTLTFKVPSNCPAGAYNIGFGSKCDVNEDNSEKLYSVGKLNGVIHVDNGTTTTTVTTTTDTTTTVTSTTPPAGKKVPNWGDTNEDGVVKVNDVVILNRFLNSTMDLTDQAKVNADCYNPQDPTGGAVDPTKVDLSIADSDAILQRCVHLIELPVVK